MRIFAIASICAAALSLGAAPAYDCPALFARHSALRAALARSVLLRDWNGMERISRAGKALDPTDPHWRYNLACALSRKGESAAALEELEKAVELGFADPQTVVSDEDLAPLRTSARFAAVLEKARGMAERREIPATVPVAREAARCEAGGSAVLGERNFTWNYDLGILAASLELSMPSGASAREESRKGPCAETVRRWIAEGSAAGNAGDFYMNRDGGHSRIDVRRFPLLSTVSFDGEGVKRGFGTCPPIAALPSGFALFTNCSRAYAKGPRWRSLPRAWMADRILSARLSALYLSNQINVFPASKDFGGKAGDVFPAATPCVFITKGESWSDRPLLEMLLSASAALRPDVKKEILRRGLFAPVMQCLLRKSVRGAESILSPEANPTVFDTKAIDARKLVEAAHALAPDAIPPAVKLDFIEINPPKGRLPMPGLDYPDIAPEPFCITPFSSCFVLRAPEGVREFSLSAAAIGAAPGETAEFAWRVTHGDASAARITVEEGSGGARAKLRLDRRRLRARVDVACFAKTAGSGWGAPSFVSFLPVSRELRSYDGDGRILSVNYTNPSGKYSDPEISLPKNWTDVYTYGKDGKLEEILRIRADGSSAGSFTPDGELVKARGADGRPSETVKVRYMRRSTGDPDEPFDLTWVEVPGKNAPTPRAKEGPRE